MNQKEKANIIKNSVTMQEILQVYRLNINRRGRIPCPIHNGKDKNFSYNNWGFQCFVCGAKGSVIDFVMQYCNLSFSEALEEINAHFHLWPSETVESTKVKKLKFSDRLFSAIAADERGEKTRTDDFYLNRLNRLADEILRLRKNFIAFAPKNINTLDERYIEACMKLPELQYEFDCLYQEAREVRNHDRL